MGLRPGWRFIAIFKPMDQGGLVAPLRELRHNPAVHARLHKGAHRRLVTPDGCGSRKRDRHRGIQFTARLPGARLAWYAARIDWKTNCGR